MSVVFQGERKHKIVRALSTQTIKEFSQEAKKETQNKTQYPSSVQFPIKRYNSRQTSIYHSNKNLKKNYLGINLTQNVRNLI